jgi:integrase/recombinase XerD
MAQPRRDAALTLAVAGFLQECRSVHTEAAYRADLQHFAAWCATNKRLNLLTADAADIARYRTACELEGAGAATVARRLSAIVSFNGYATDHGLQPALATDFSVERPTLERASTADILSDADATALLDAADEIGPRAGVLIRLLMLDGLKVGEVTRADASDVRGRPPRVTLTLHGRSERKLELHADTAAALHHYLGRRRSGPLLLSEKRGQPAGRLTRFGIDYLVKQIAEAAGIDATVSGNTLRRRSVIEAHALGTDLDTIRHNMGHAAQQTTRRYLAEDGKTTRRPDPGACVSCGIRNSHTPPQS